MDRIFHQVFVHVHTKFLLKLHLFQFRVLILRIIIIYFMVLEFVRT